MEEIFRKMLKNWLKEEEILLTEYLSFSCSSLRIYISRVCIYMLCNSYSVYIYAL